MPTSPNDPDYKDIMRKHREHSLELRYRKNQSKDAKRLRDRLNYQKSKSAQNPE